MACIESSSNWYALSACFLQSNILDAAITEALSNPLTPMPLGLKPPSMDGVLEELTKQGIAMPPAAPEGQAAAGGADGAEEAVLITTADGDMEASLEAMMAQ